MQYDICSTAQCCMTGDIKFRSCVVVVALLVVTAYSMSSSGTGWEPFKPRGAAARKQVPLDPTSLPSRRYLHPFSSVSLTFVFFTCTFLFLFIPTQNVRTDPDSVRTFSMHPLRTFCAYMIRISHSPCVFCCAHTHTHTHFPSPTFTHTHPSYMHVLSSFTY